MIKKFVHQLFKRLEQSDQQNTDTSETSATTATTSATESVPTEVADDANSSQTLQQQLEAAMTQFKSVTAVIPVSIAIDRTLLTSRCTTMLV